MMPASDQEVKALVQLFAGSVAQTIYDRDGEEELKKAISRATVAAKQDAVISGLSSAISVTVSNWTNVQAVLSAPALSSDKTATILRDIKTCLDGKDASKLGPLFIMLYGSVKQQFGVG